MKLNNLTVRGYKSIRALEGLELGNLNLLIGANGAGKSNLISLFRLLAEISLGNLQTFVQEQGGPDIFLFGGRKRTKKLEARFEFTDIEYTFTLAPTFDKYLCRNMLHFVYDEPLNPY